MAWILAGKHGANLGGLLLGLSWFLWVFWFRPGSPFFSIIGGTYEPYRIELIL
jgi:hypothetical protein